MKNLNIAVGILVIGISATCISCAGLITSERIVSSFEKISLVGSAEVRFHASEEYRAVVTVDSNLDVYTEVYGNVLSIETKGGGFLYTKCLVDVYCPTLTGVSITGSGSFTGNGTIITSTFDASVSGSGELTGTVECNNFSARISGSGKMMVIGSSKDSNIVVSGSGNFRGTGFSTNNAIVGISGSGGVSISVTDNLKANIYGSGVLNYRGEPKTDFSVAGSGKINKI